MPHRICLAYAATSTISGVLVLLLLFFGREVEPLFVVLAMPLVAAGVFKIDLRKVDEQRATLIKQHT
jgi:hypothetical protein